MIPCRKTQILDRQKRMFRIATDPARYGLTLKMIAADANLGYDSVRHYSLGETEMPMSAFDALVGVIPNELLSLLLPAGRAIVSMPDDIDHDALADACHDYLRRKTEAHHPASPSGRDIADVEDKDLRASVAVLRARAA